MAANLLQLQNLKQKIQTKFIVLYMHLFEFHTSMEVVHSWPVFSYYAIVRNKNTTIILQLLFTNIVSTI